MFPFSGVSAAFNGDENNSIKPAGAIIELTKGDKELRLVNTRSNRFEIREGESKVVQRFGIQMIFAGR